MELVADPDMQAGLDLIETGLDLLFAQGAKPVSAKDADACVKAFERVGRRMHAAQVRLQDRIDVGGLFVEDGHAGAKSMVRHRGRLSDGEAAAREKCVRVLRDLPQVAEAFEAGELGIDYVRLLGRVHANPRVRERMPANQGRFLRAAELPFKVFEQRVRKWERLTDEDGPEPKASIGHEKRNVRLVMDSIDLTWHLDGQFGSLQGAEINEIFEHYIRAEYLADWETARAEHGAAACEADLPRTPQQRRADAMAAMASDAAASGCVVPKDWVHNIVWDADTYEQMAARILDEDHEPEPLDPDTMVCETMDGVPVDPVEASVHSIISLIRRVVVTAAGVPIDLGRARFFTGAARDAVMLQSGTCVWPGCTVPSSACEADHLDEYGEGGRTNPGNGAPLCGRHNRWKQKGFTVHRSPDGTWHTIRPDGTEIDP